MDNLILNTDGYKLSHEDQYPPSVTRVSSYIEARGVEEGRDWKEHVFMGTQALVDRLQYPVTTGDLEEALDFSHQYGVPLNPKPWKHIIDNNGGYLPLYIEALDEGSVVPIGTPLFQQHNVDDETRSFPCFTETMALRAIWYPSTIATISFHAKRTIKKYLLETGCSLAGIDFMLHDFGARGVSSDESAALGGAAHLMVFQGSDTLSGIRHIQKHYAPKSFPGFSVPAAEHSTITSWGKDYEVDAYRNMLKTYAKPNAIISVVSDSYNIYHAVDQLWGGILRDEVNALAKIGARLVVRPDSGNPLKVPIEIVQLLMDKFGYVVTPTGHRLLPPHVRVLQGDGITEKTIGHILANASMHKLAAENFVFGMGGGLLQQCNRDTLKFAMKCNSVKDQIGAWRDVFKDPAAGGKTSKRGRQAVVHHLDGTWKSYPVSSPEFGAGQDRNELKCRYDNGFLVNNATMEEVRKRINDAL